MIARVCLVAILVVGLGWAPPVRAERPEELSRGYRLLVDKPFVGADLDEEVFDNIWRVWPVELRKRAERAGRLERRKMAFRRYGLTPRPENIGTKLEYEQSLQYVVHNNGQWSTNCFSCHGGTINGRVVPGLPNSNFALQTMAEEVLETKVLLKRTLRNKDLGLLFMPLSRTAGTTNAVMFGVLLLGLRDEQLNVHRERGLPKLVNHDMDAPPWWHYHKRNTLYIDGFAPKGHRPLMQFMLVTENGPRKFTDCENDFRHIEAYMNSLRPPKYPFAIDEKLAAEGRTVFNDNCSRCHGTYGKNGKYPGKRIAIDDVATDRVRLDALSAANRRHYRESWFAAGHRDRVLSEPDGYVAPPLDGIWASAPYLHNGSVPTLWHLMHAAQRPQVWRRSSPDRYDSQRVGLPFKPFDKMPAGLNSKQARRYFDTGRFGMSNQGHGYFEPLDEPQKRALLEYLKTL